MKKPLFTFAACSLAFASPLAIPTAANAYPNDVLVEICKDLVDNGYFLSVGDCADHAADYCKEQKKSGAFELENGFRNQGDCVYYIKLINSQPWS
jgi:hypothetical protein